MDNDTESRKNSSLMHLSSRRSSQFDTVVDLWQLIRDTQCFYMLELPAGHGQSTKHIRPMGFAIHFCVAESIELHQLAKSVFDDESIYNLTQRVTTIVNVVPYILVQSGHGEAGAIR